MSLDHLVLELVVPHLSVGTSFACAARSAERRKWSERSLVDHLPPAVPETSLPKTAAASTTDLAVSRLTVARPVLRVGRSRRRVGSARRLESGCFFS